MSRKNLHALLKRYRKGECTSREKYLVERWFTLLEKGNIPIKEEEYELTETKIWSEIQKRNQYERRAKIIPIIWKLVGAAIVVIGFCWSFYHFSLKDSQSDSTLTFLRTSKEDLERFENRSDTSRNILLSDGSEVMLSPKSSIDYQVKVDGRSREVFLKGKAFFKVARDVDKPFYVYAGGITTRVIGTSFWVDESPSTSGVEVSVVTGKVSVSQNSKDEDAGMAKVKDGVILTANQRVKFKSDNQAFETGLVENPVLIVPDAKEKDNSLFVFSDTPITEVVSKIEKSYGVEIILENESLASCLFTADITHQPLFDKLDLLCSTITANYEVRGTRILISGKGCKNSN